MMSDEPNQLMVIDSLEPFERDKDYLRKEIKIPKNDQNRKWFFSEALEHLLCAVGLSLILLSFGIKD